MTRKNNISSWLFIFPAGIIYLSVVIFPVLYTTVISLFRWNGISRMVFIGLNNFFDLFKDPIFLKAISNNLIWVILSLLGTMTVALALAVMLNRKFFGRTFFRGFFYFPAVIAGITTALIWRWIYNPDFGFINQLFMRVGINFQQSWISSPQTSLYAVFIASLWQSVGMPMIFFLAGLQTVPEEVLEAAIIDGASNMRRFFIVTIPMMKETFFIVIANLIVGSMKVFDVVMGLTGGGPNDATQMMSTYMYNQAFRYNNVGYGSAIAVLMVVFMVLIIVPYVRTVARD